MNPEQLRTIGVVVGAHGLQGTLKVEPLSDFPERFEALKDVYLVRDNAVVGMHSVKRARWSNQIVLITLHDLTTRTAAEIISGCELCVPLKDSWKLPDNAYYASDLIGYSGVAEDGRELGKLVKIHQSGQDLLEFEGVAGNLLVPFVEAWVGEIDEEKGTIQILNWRGLADAESIEPSSEDDH